MGKQTNDVSSETIFSSKRLNVRKNPSRFRSDVTISLGTRPLFAELMNKDSGGFKLGKRGIRITKEIVLDLNRGTLKKMRFGLQQNSTGDYFLDCRFQLEDVREFSNFPIAIGLQVWDTSVKHFHGYMFTLPNNNPGQYQLSDMYGNGNVSAIFLGNPIKFTEYLLLGVTSY